MHTVKRALTVITTAIVIMTSFGLVLAIEENAYAASSEGQINVGADVLKNEVNANGAQLVYMGDRYWYVIGFDGQGVASGSDEITLLSEDGIKAAPFDKECHSFYRNSNLKKEIDAFTDGQFSAGEKGAIVPRTLGATVVDSTRNKKWWMNNYQTVDEVIDENPIEGVLLWPLGAKEASAVDPEVRKTGSDYWLRSLGRPGYYVYEYDEREDEEYEEYIPPAMAIVKGDGSIAIQSENSSYWKGMRPAFKLRKSDVILTSAPDGKVSSEDGKLTPYEESYTDNKWKLTLRDEEHKSFKADSCDVELGEQGSLTVKYTGAKIGDREYISAIIKSADGCVKQYGRVAKVTASSGTATITGLPTDSSGKASLPEGDKLYVFSEQYNGEGKTDFSSNLQEVSLTGHKWVFDEFYHNQSTGNTIARYHCSIDSAHKETATASHGFEYVDPTCSKKGEMDIVYTISEDTSLDGKAHREVTKIADWQDPLGHKYTSFCGFRWTGDATAGYSKAEAIFRCERDSSHVTYVNAVVTSKEQKPTCTAIGRTLYEANLSADKSPDGKDHGEAKYAKAKPRLGHDWGEPTYEWAADNSSVTATCVCKRDGNHVETETVETEITNVTKAPTCKAKGMGDIKTKPFTNDAFQEQTMTNVELPVDPDAHVWDEGEKQGDTNVCGGYTTIYRCTLCESGQKEEITGGSDHTFSSDWTYFPEPTCTESGQRFHECTKCGAFDFGDFDVLDPTGHKWEFDSFTWTGNETDGYEKAVANYVCENDPSHTMTAIAEISEEVVDPTCQAGGKTVYTASVSEADSPDETAHSESKDAEATEKAPHEWEYSGMEWTGDETDGYTKAVAKYTCEFGCESTAEVEAGITEKETEADCEHEGKTTYTATVEAENSLTGKKYTDTKVAKVSEALGHKWHYKDMIWTGNEEDGFTKAEVKFTCDNDERHVELVDATITEEVIEPTCVEQGYTLYKASLKAKDSLTGYEVYDYNIAKIKEATGHAWELKGFTWTENEKYGYRAEANYICKHDGSHAESIGADMRITEKTATCEEPGGTLYTATVNRDKSLTDAVEKDNKFIKKADPTGHKWSSWKVTRKATVSANGTLTRTCSLCGKKETRSIPQLKVSGTLMLNAVATGNNGLRLNWLKVNNADGYDIFMSKCNHKGRKYSPKKVKTIKGNGTLKWTRAKLSKRTAYKVYIKAYVIKNGKKSYVRTSPTVHAFTTGYRGQYTNPKSVSVSRKAVSLSKGKTYTIKASVSKLKNGKKLPTSHAANLRYLSSNNKVAMVNRSGKITARGKGNCNVFVYAANGVWRTMKVSVF